VRESLTILHPTDFCDLCEPAFRLACSRAAEHEARLVILHVAPPPVYGIIEWLGQEYDRLWKKLHRLQAPDWTVHVEHLLRCGDPATEILRAARALDCDLIVMGTHGRTRLRRLLRGSVTEAVAREAPCEVLAIPALSQARKRPKGLVLAQTQAYTQECS
jgi:nucleotide-binding universal stress UspA family protein